jgi:hypothetical protein
MQYNVYYIIIIPFCNTITLTRYVYSCSYNVFISFCPPCLIWKDLLFYLFYLFIFIYIYTYLYIYIYFTCLHLFNLYLFYLYLYKYFYFTDVWYFSAFGETEGLPLLEAFWRFQRPSLSHLNRFNNIKKRMSLFHQLRRLSWGGGGGGRNANPVTGRGGL